MSSIINYEKLWESIVNFARRAGCISARLVLLLYYVMKSPNTTTSDKILILSAISYLVLPIDLISARRLPIIGWLDEVVALTVTYRLSTSLPKLKLKGMKFSTDGSRKQ